MDIILFMLVLSLCANAFLWKLCAARKFQMQELATIISALKIWFIKPDVDCLEKVYGQTAVQNAAEKLVLHYVTKEMEHVATPTGP